MTLSDLPAGRDPTHKEHAHQIRWEAGFAPTHCLICGMLWLAWMAAPEPVESPQQGPAAR